MTRFRNNFVFVGLSLSAYMSPLLMIVSILTSRWLFSFERVPKDQVSEYAALLTSTTTTTTITTATNHNATNLHLLSNLTQAITTTTSTNTIMSKRSSSSTQRKMYFEAAFGLWNLCSVSMITRELECNSVSKFDVDNKVTDSLKKQIRDCILPLLFALLIMIVSVLLHTYALVYKFKLYYMLLLSGCLFIFAGLLSLTGLIFFISAVNGAIDNKYSSSKSNDEEAQFSYKYGFSFYCCIISFLLQEFDGIFSVIWYIDYFRKYRHKIGGGKEGCGGDRGDLIIESLPERLNYKKQRSESMKKKSFNNNKNPVITITHAALPANDTYMLGIVQPVDYSKKELTTQQQQTITQQIGFCPDSNQAKERPSSEVEKEPPSSSSTPPCHLMSEDHHPKEAAEPPSSQKNDERSMSLSSSVRVIKVNAKCDCMRNNDTKKAAASTGNEFLFKKALCDASAALFQYLTRQREDMSRSSSISSPLQPHPLIEQHDHHQIPTYCIEKSNDYQPLTRYVVENNIFVVKNVSGHEAFVNIGKKSLKRTTSV